MGAGVKADRGARRSLLDDDLGPIAALSLSATDVAGTSTAR